MTVTERTVKVEEVVVWRRGSSLERTEGEYPLYTQERTIHRIFNICGFQEAMVHAYTCLPEIHQDTQGAQKGFLEQ